MRETASHRYPKSGGRCPRRDRRPLPGRGLEGTEPLVAPDPAAVLALLGVVQDAAPQRRLGAGRVVLDRAGEQVVEAVEALGPVDEVGDGRRLLLVHPRRHVDQHHLADQLRARGRPARWWSCPPSDMPTPPARPAPGPGSRRRRPWRSRRRRPSPCGRRRSGRGRGGRWRRAGGPAPSPPCPRCARSGRRRAGGRARARRRPTRARSAGGPARPRPTPGAPSAARRRAARTPRRSRGTWRTRRTALGLAACVLLVGFRRARGPAAATRP